MLPPIFEDLEAVPWVASQLRRLGVGRCFLQADGEPTRWRFVRDVAETIAAVSNLGVVATERGTPSLAPRWDQATYLGTRRCSAEHWVAAADAVAKQMATIRRVPTNVRCSPWRIREVTGVFNQPSRALAGEPAPVLVVPMLEDEVERGPGVPGERSTSCFVTC